MPVGRGPGYARAFPLISKVQVENTEGESSTRAGYPARELLIGVERLPQNRDSTHVLS